MSCLDRNYGDVSKYTIFSNCRHIINAPVKHTQTSNGIETLIDIAILRWSHHQNGVKTKHYSVFNLKPCTLFVFTSSSGFVNTCVSQSRHLLHEI